MQYSKQLAQLIGPTLLALSLSETLNLSIWRVNLAPVTYLNGTLLFIAGLSIVRVHNRWSRSWPVLVTLVGWGAVAAGLFRMLMPELKQGGPEAPTYVTLAVLSLIGAALTFRGYAS